MEKILIIASLFFFLTGIILLLISIKFYKEQNVRKNMEELKIIDRETPDVSSNIEAYRKAEGLGEIDSIEKDEDGRASFLRQGEGFYHENEEEAIVTIKKEASEKKESEESSDNEKTSDKTGRLQFLENLSEEEKEGVKDQEEDEDDDTAFLNTASLGSLKEEKKEKEEDKTGILFREAEF